MNARFAQWCASRPHFATVLILLIVLVAAAADATFVSLLDATR